MNFQQYLQPLINFLHVNPHYAGIITFVVVFMEAMAVIGVIVPGCVTMTAIGILIGSNVIPAGSTLLWGVAGAISGDYISYLLGVLYQDRLHRIWPFKKHPQLLIKSEEFFHKHGGKSVFIGRFIGPMRAMVPMVAGMLKMTQIRFLFAAIPSVAVWTILYMLPGIVLGALSLELPPKIATEFILGVFVVLFVVWLITWLIQDFARRTYRWLDSCVMRMWFFMRRHKNLYLIPNLLSDPREPENHRQLSLLILLIVAIAVFFVIFVNVLFQWNLTILNQPVYHFLSSIRIAWLDRIMVAITFLGQYTLLFATAFLILGWFVYRRYWYVAVHWSLLVFFCAGNVLLFKYMIFIPRPGGELNFDPTSSFPSGHTTISAALYGFWAIVAASNLPTGKRWIVYTPASIIIALISFSRLYLGAHWLTDVAAGLSFGLFIVLLFAISYRRRHTVHFSLCKFTLLSTCLLFLMWASYSAIFLNKNIAKYSLKWQEQTIAVDDWKNQIGQAIPLYRADRIGTPIQAFNLEWLGDIATIEKDLLDRQWTKQPSEIKWRGFAAHLVEDNIESHLPLLNQLYHDRPVALLMTKETDEENTVAILRLWKSDIKMEENSTPLWLGTVEFHRNVISKFLKIPHRDKHTPKFMGAAEELRGYLPSFTWQKMIVPADKQPPEMKNLHWNGEVFLVRPR